MEVHSPAVGVLVLAPEERVDKILRRGFLPRSPGDDGVVVAVLRRALTKVCKQA